MASRDTRVSEMAGRNTRVSEMAGRNTRVSEMAGRDTKDSEIAIRNTRVSEAGRNTENSKTAIRNAEGASKVSDNIRDVNADLTCDTLASVGFKPNSGPLKLTAAQVDAVLFILAKPTSLIIMDMGWGKTLSLLLAYAFDRRNRPARYASRPSLIVAPGPAVLGVWKAHIEKYTTWAKHTLYVTDSKHIPKTTQRLAGYRLVVISHSQLANAFRKGFEYHYRVESFTRRDGKTGSRGAWLPIAHRDGTRGNILFFEGTYRTKWGFVAIDEAHHTKNENTLLCESFKHASHGAWKRVALTGTPVVNSPADFVGIAKALNAAPEDLRLKFKLDDEQSVRALLAIKQQIVYAPEVATRGFELPPLDVRIVEVKHGLYLEYLESYNAALRKAQSIGLAIENAGPGNQRMMYALNAALGEAIRHTCVPQMVDHPGGIKVFDDRRLNEAADFPLPKMEKALELARMEVGRLGKTMVVSHFAVPLYVLEIMLRREGIRSAKLVGGQSAEKRDAVITEFLSDGPDAPQVLLVMMGCGTEGLNLLSPRLASVIFLMPYWSWPPMAQALTRVYRRGQTNPVTVHLIIAKGTIDEGIMFVHSDKTRALNLITSREPVEPNDFLKWKLIASIAKSCYLLKAGAGVEVGDETFPDRAQSANITDVVAWTQFLMQRRATMVEKAAREAEEARKQKYQSDHESARNLEIESSNRAKNSVSVIQL